MRYRRLVLLLAITLLVLVASEIGTRALQAAPRRFFPETGFAVESAELLDYFDRRGGIRAFGYPISRELTLHGLTVQIFQRAVMHKAPDGRVALLNLLDLGMLPYTTMNGAQFPSVDQELVASAPSPESPGYHAALLQWIREVAPDEWNGLPVGFHRTFSSTVQMSDAFPGGNGAPELLSGFNLEIWGAPTSRPAFDPSNQRFVYQRFQRGILHFDQDSGQTQGILIGDYFKKILLGEGLPADLADAAKASPYYRQYNPLNPTWVDRPDQLLSTDLTRAFEPSTPVIVLDPGHGGTDLGSRHLFSDGIEIREKELTVAVAIRAAAGLREHGYIVILSRTLTSDLGLAMRDLTGDGVVGLSDDLQARVDLANHVGANLFVSIHFNGHNNPSMRGTSVYYNNVRPFARRNRYIAELLQKETVAGLNQVGYGTVDLGVLEDSRAAGTGKHFYVLGPHATRPTQVPGALVEGLFLSNEQDAQQVRDPKILNALGDAYARAVLSYFGDLK